MTALAKANVRSLSCRHWPRARRVRVGVKEALRGGRDGQVPLE